MGDLFLGLDSSTQSLSAVIIDLETKKVVLEDSFDFAEKLPHYATSRGVLRSEDPQVVHSPPEMWAEALDAFLGEMKQAGVPLSQIRAVSGSGQQHGTVYLNKEAQAVLASFDAHRPLGQQIEKIFSRRTSPIWMDSSTGKQCQEIMEALGGPEATARLTGSIAFKRFSGPQIRKFYQEDRKAYEKTACIQLVSSYMASLLAGRLVPVDPGDGAGTNLMDIRTRNWSQAALDATAPRLGAKLLPVAASPSPGSLISPYYQGRFGFHPETKTYVWSGDNPNSLIGVGLVQEGRIAISMGTSDTYFGLMTKLRTDPRGEGHVFGSPTGDYMTLICFQNGSLAREKVKDQHHYDWNKFSQALRDTPPGNRGRILLPYFDPEIVPNVPQPLVARYGLETEDGPGNVRAVVEAQMMSMHIHSRWMGVEPCSIYATGGAAKNREILQVMADVHNAEVFRFPSGNSAALGAALRAAHAYLGEEGEGADWKGVVAGFAEPIRESRCVPRKEYVKIYRELIKIYQACEEHALRGGPDPNPLRESFQQV